MRIDKFFSLWCCLSCLCVSVANSGGFFPRFLVSYEDKICAPPLGDFCIEIRQCRFFSDLLDRTSIPRPRSVVKIIRDHQCGFENNKPKVCCSSSISTTSTAATTTTTTTTPRPSSANRFTQKAPTFYDRLTDDLSSHKNYRLLPLDKCGPISTNSRITSGRQTGLEEFPWMALIAYNTPEVGIEFRCGGTILNERYILTAAHCILNSTILGVRLGEYNLTDTIQDCDGSYCSPPVQDFYVKDTVVHAKYNPKTFENDIALIRLATPANFSSNVQPICLPVGEVNDDLIGKFAIVSGWGVTEDGHKSPVLLKASIPVLPITACKKVYHRFAPISANQICAGGYRGLDSCAGDSGGPMTYVGLVDGTPRFIRYGIVSYGPKECGTDSQPGIYTRVGGYLRWILDNMKDAEH